MGYVPPPPPPVDFCAASSRPLMYTPPPTIRLSLLKCPQCGAPMRNRRECEYCGSRFESNDMFSAETPTTYKMRLGVGVR